MSTWWTSQGAAVQIRSRLILGAVWGWGHVEELPDCTFQLFLCSRNKNQTRSPDKLVQTLLLDISERYSEWLQIMIVEIFSDLLMSTLYSYSYVDQTYVFHVLLEWRSRLLSGGRYTAYFISGFFFLVTFQFSSVLVIGLYWVKLNWGEIFSKNKQKSSTFFIYIQMRG